MASNADIWDADFKPLEVIDRTRNLTHEHTSRHRGSQRISKGMFYTDKERKEKRDALRSLRLP